MPLKELLRHQYGDVAVKILNQMVKQEGKYIKVCNNLTFLLRCRDNNIIPKGLILKSPVQSQSATNILKKASALLLRERIQHYRNVKHRKSSITKDLHHQLRNILPQETYESTNSKMKISNEKLNLKVKTQQTKKFIHLMQDQPVTPTINHNHDNYLTKTVVNLSSKQLTKDQINLLSKGLKFIPVRVPKNSDDFITNIEKGLRQLAPGGKLNYLRHQITNILSKSPAQPNNLTKPESKALMELKEDHEIAILPADKGKATVIMDRTEYISTVNELLQDKTTYRRLRKDPTSTYENKLKGLLTNLKDDAQLNPDLFYQLKPSHPRAPYARATIKIHKNPIKARLLVCSRDSVFYNTAQYLAKLLSPLGKQAESFISDSGDFVEKD